MKLFKYGMSLAAVALLASCANDNVIDPGTNPTPGSSSTGDMYVTLNVSQQVGTRTATSADMETEAGQAFENAVTNATIFLVGPNDEIKKTITISTSDGWTIAQKSGSSTNTVDYTMTGKVDRDEMIALASDGEGTQYDLFVVCNAPASLSLSGDLTTNKHVVTIANLEALLTNYANTTTGTFLMSNADATVDGNERTKSKAFISTDLAESAEHYINPTVGSAVTDAFPLGTVKVQRAVARFDYAKDATVFESDDNVNGVDITLVGMALVNVNNKFSLFKQVTNDAGVNWKYFMSEVPADSEERYVFNPNYTDAASALLGASKNGTPDTYFDRPLFNEQNTQKNLNSLSYTAVPTSTTYSNIGDYYFWTYCSPNTIHDKNEQKNGISTGIVFRALITPKSGDTTSDFYKATQEGKQDKVYAFADKIFGDFEALKAYAAVADNANEAAVIAYNNVKQALTAETEETENNMKEGLKAAGFAVYKWEAAKSTDSGDAYNSEAGFYCYYIYWNEHNEGTKATMEPMEFGVVRNNIYKLKVSSIKSLGHPADPGDDPDPTTPDTPDQEVKMYMTVEIQVVPWTVRENEINF